MMLLLLMSPMPPEASAQQVDGLPIRGDAETRVAEAAEVSSASLKQYGHLIMWAAQWVERDSF